MKRILVTGGAGFIGTNLVKLLLEKTDYTVVILDALTYAGNLENFTPEEQKSLRFIFIHGDIRDKSVVSQAMKSCDAVVHLAAETHVDRSIANPEDFITTEVYGTYQLLEAARNLGIERFLFISSSEVYGSAQQIPMTELHPLNPQSPYAAAKLGAERLAYAYYQTYHLPVILIRPFNNYGPYQYPEKFISLCIINALQNFPLPLYGAGENTRDWLYVTDHVDALLLLLQADISSLSGEVLNFATGIEITNREVAERILALIPRSKSQIQSVPDRPGHVLRLCGSFEKVQRLLSWRPATSFTQGLEKTVEWYFNHSWWWKRIIQKRKEWDPRREMAGYIPFLSKSLTKQ